MKDYYAVLGVTMQAEDIVIRAAYKALAQRYHPDRFKGPVDEAHRRMAEINEAYGVLSDATRRKTFDAEYQQAGGNKGDFDAGDEAADAGGQQLDQDWALALDYYPDLATLEATLLQTSKSLGFTFRLIMITEKQFKHRQQIATAIHDVFLKNYFGKKPEIINFAKILIELGRKDAAKALNEAARVLGDDLDTATVIARIKTRYGLLERPANKLGVDQELWLRATGTNASIDDVRLVVKELGGDSQVWGTNFLITLKGVTREFLSERDCVSWFQKIVAPQLTG